MDQELITINQLFAKLDKHDLKTQVRLINFVSDRCYKKLRDEDEKKSRDYMTAAVESKVESNEKLPLSQ